MAQYVHLIHLISLHKCSFFFFFLTSTLDNVSCLFPSSESSVKLTKPNVYEVLPVLKILY